MLERNDSAKRLLVTLVLDSPVRMQAETATNSGVLHMSAGNSNSPRILIVGAGGQVGMELQRSFAGFGTIVAVELGCVVGVGDRVKVGENV